MEVVYGGFWRRWLAFWIDAALTILILMPLLGLLGVHDAGFNEAVHHSARSVMLNVPYIVASTLFLHFKGATPGKMVMGLRVVDADTLAPLSLAQAFGRQLATLLSLFVFFLGFIWIAFDSRKQGWHDKLARTLVVLPSASVGLPPR